MPFEEFLFRPRRWNVRESYRRMRVKIARRRLLPVPETRIEIMVSKREADRPRLLQVTARDGAWKPLEGVPISLTVDQDGTFFDDADPVRQRKIVTGSHGLAFFQWFEWPRGGPGRDFSSVIVATWQSDDVHLRLEDLYE
jgi:hypothetical protein